ncbi:hypothetical protein [Gemmiger formicilis]|uniref:hypothetical protein n=1 Tax=Gemmiger formicilis TaxID=745368 RepID=UPI0039955505
MKIEPGTPLILPLQPAILSQNRTTKGADLWAAVTLPTHYRNVFAELGYAQAEIDARRYYDNCLYFLPCWPSAADTAFGRCKAF